MTTDPNYMKWAKSILGEGIHASLRKGGESPEAGDAWDAIDKMPTDDWDSVLEFLVEGLDTMGITLVEQEVNG